MTPPQHCPRCRAAGPVVLSIKAADGQALTRVACRGCHQITWCDCTEQPIPLVQVFAITNGDPSFTLQTKTPRPRSQR